MKKVLFILGTAREGRRSERVASFVLSCARERGDMDVTFLDIADFAQTRTGGLIEDKLEKLKNALIVAEALVIIAPEYNHSYPGELKMFLDNADKEYVGKPVGFCAVSSGVIGGARMAEQLKLVMSAFQMFIINRVVHFPKVTELWDEAGELREPDAWKVRVNAMLDDLLKYSLC